MAAPGRALVVHGSFRYMAASASVTTTSVASPTAASAATTSVAAPTAATVATTSVSAPTAASVVAAPASFPGNGSSQHFCAVSRYDGFEHGFEEIREGT